MPQHTMALDAYLLGDLIGSHVSLKLVALSPILGVDSRNATSVKVQDHRVLITGEDGGRKAERCIVICTPRRHLLEYLHFVPARNT